MDKSQALRGTGLSTRSLKDEVGVEFAPRVELGFDCLKGHHVDITFATEAELPTQWECPRCGEIAVRSDGTQAEAKETKPPRTHWDMLLERRSLSDLEVLLKERVAEVRTERS